MEQKITSKRARYLLENCEGEYKKKIVKEVLKKIDENLEEVVVNLEDIFQNLKPIKQLEIYCEVFKPDVASGIGLLVEIASKGKYVYKERPLESLRFIKSDCTDKYKN